MRLRFRPWVTLSIVLLAASLAGAQTVTFHYVSEPGDYIGQGQTATWTSDDGDWYVYRNSDNGVSLNFYEFPFPSGSNWSLDFAHPDRIELVAGSYPNATRWPFQDPGVPGLAVAGEGRGCNTLTGEFTVADAVYDWYGEPVRFAAQFEQHCEGAVPALNGTIDYDVGLGAALGSSDLVITYANRIFEYTRAGVRMQVIPILESDGTPPDSTEWVRDLVLDQAGYLHVFNGTFDPVLSSSIPGTQTWVHHAYPGWSTVNNLSYGGVATIGPYVFVTDMRTNLAEAQGLIRLDTGAGYSGQRFATGEEYIDATIGWDGYLYALRGGYVDVFHPMTLALVRTVSLPGDSHAVAANADGDLFVVDFDGMIKHFSPDGTLVDSLDTGITYLNDIDLDGTGALLVGSRMAGAVLTDESFSSLTPIFPEADDVVFVAFNVPPPELPAAVQFSSDTATVAEDAGTVSLTVTRIGVASSAVSVSYITTSGSALPGSDYVHEQGTLTWAAYDTTPKTVDIAIVNDATREGDETFKVVLFNAVGAMLGSPYQTEVTITDDDVSTLQLAAAAYTVTEGDGQVVLTVTRTGQSNYPVGVHYATADGSAGAPADYTERSGQVFWAAGDATDRTITVPIIADGVDEGDETFTVAIFNPSTAAVLGDPSSAIVTISGNAGNALFLGGAAYSVAESAGTLTVTVQRTGSGVGAVGVSYDSWGQTAAAFSDFTPVSGTLAWADGDLTEKSFAIPILQDTLLEGDETLVVQLSNVTGVAVLGSPWQATVTITDDDASYLQFSAPTFTVSEASGPAEVTVTRTGGGSYPVGVYYTTGDGTATAPEDYTTQQGSLYWAAGDMSDRTVTIPVVADSITEGTETFFLSLLHPSSAASLGTPSAAVVAIVEGPADSSLSLEASSYNVGEGQGSVTITAIRLGSGFGAVSVDYFTTEGSATAGADFTATSGTLSWPDGDTAPKTFVVPILEDTLSEGSESFSVTLSNPIGASLVPPSEALVTIADNEAVSSLLHFSASSYAVGEAAGSVNISVQRTGTPNGAVSVAYATSNGTAIAGQDYLAASGVLSWADGDLVDKQFTVVVYNDDVTTGPVSLNLTLSSPVGDAALGSPSQASLSITDDEWVEFQANVYTPQGQTRPVVGMDASGAFVVAWDSFLQDGSGAAVIARRFDSSGAPLGGEFQVNTYTTLDQRDASLAVAPNGTFVIAWESAAQDGSGNGVFMRRFGADGLPLAGELQVNTTASGAQEEPAVAVDDSGVFMVVWQSANQDGSGEGVFGRVYDASGVALTGELPINTTTANDQAQPAVDAVGSGGFVVVWESFGQASGSTLDVIGRMYTAGGTPASGELVLNSYVPGDQARPSVATAPDGSFLALWEDRGGYDGSGIGVYGRWFTAAGVADGNEFLCNTYTTSDQTRPVGTVRGADEALVAWDSVGQDGSGRGVYAQAVSRSGALVGSEVRLNTYTLNTQYWPGLDSNSAGATVAVWASSDQDGSGDGVFGLLLQAPTGLFSDDFESGDTAAWTVTVP